MMQATPTTTKLVPQMLHHLGYVTHDAAKTVDFYARVLGLEFTATVMDDRVPSTGDPFPYLHLFFRMPDGSTVAFFECPNLPARPQPSHPAYDVFDHLALAAASREEVDAWARRLTENGVSVLGPIDHGVIYSIYFHDPNGIRLELTTTLIASWLDHAPEAQRDLDDWEAAKRRAASAGTDPNAELLDVIRRKRQTMKERGLILADDIAVAASRPD